MLLENNERRVDEILDRTLAAYGECEPPQNLEEDILKLVRATGSRRFSATRWLPVLALAAGVLVGVIVIRDWRSVPAAKTTVGQLAAPAPRNAAPNVERHRPVDKAAPTGFQRRPIVPKAHAAGPQMPAEESPISPLPQSPLAFSDIPSSPIEIEALGKDTAPLIPDLPGDDSSNEGGREQ